MLTLARLWMGVTAMRQMMVEQLGLAMMAPSLFPLGPTQVRHGLGVNLGDDQRHALGHAEGGAVVHHKGPRAHRHGAKGLADGAPALNRAMSTPAQHRPHPSQLQSRQTLNLNPKPET